MTAPNRHSDDHALLSVLSQPTRDDPTLVVCPRCRAKAFVVPASEDEEGTAVRVVCHACGFSKTADGRARAFAGDADNPTEGYFGLDLWLQTRCAGHSLWAFNRRHLDVLDAYVSAGLRERARDAHGWRNAALASRLPRWMTAAPNRDAVLEAIRRLRAMT